MDTRWCEEEGLFWAHATGAPRWEDSRPSDALAQELPVGRAELSLGYFYGRGHIRTEKIFPVKRRNVMLQWLFNLIGREPVGKLVRLTPPPAIPRSA